MIYHWLRLFIISSLLFLQSPLASATAQLSYGKYFGFIQMEGRPDSLAVSLDAFIVQIKDPTVYPALNVIVRANLGGYFSSEYIGYNFYSPTFNYERGILQLNDLKNDLTATLQVTNSDTETILEGPVLHRMTNAKGKMRLVMKLDSDGFVSSQVSDQPFQSVLNGDYFGSCGKDAAELQIESGRGVGSVIPGNELIGYTISGRLGFVKGRVKSYSSSSPFSTGTYSPFTGRLTMQGPLGTIDCNKANDKLQCALTAYNRKGSCEFSKLKSISTTPEQLPAGFLLNTTLDQRKLLPAPLPPDNQELVDALGGDFNGYLHYENRDVYQLMHMSIIATTSTDNSHVQNQINVAPTINLILGNDWKTPPAISLFYPQRIFWMNTGFSFQADGTDIFVVITNWRQGYVNGVAYSRSYGRIGTFELVKTDFPPIPPQMKLLTSPIGAFHGPVDAPRDFNNLWNLSIEIPNQVPSPDQTGVPLLSRYAGPGISNVFDGANFDLNSGSVSLLIRSGKGDRIVGGEAGVNNRLKLLWPIGSALNAPMANYKRYTYELSLRKHGGEN